MDRKHEEFRNLTQGNMTVEAYQREFLNLSRYAEEEITTNARKQQKFRRGLNADLGLALAVHDFANFATMGTRLSPSRLPRWSSKTRKNAIVTLALLRAQLRSVASGSLTV